MFTEDLTAFFNTAEFAVSATHTPAGGQPTAAAGVIFDQNGAVAEQFGVQTSSPVAVLPTAQWPTAADGDTLTIGASTYLIRAVTPLDDGALKAFTLARSN